MQSIKVEAFEDDGHPDGGFAVIVLSGIADLPRRPRFRLKPVDTIGNAELRAAWSGKQMLPVTACVTPRGAELVVGPDVVGNALLLAGTPLAIEIAELGVRGEFLWPHVRPIAQPKRRHTIIARKLPAGGVAPDAIDLAPISEAASSAFTSEGIGEFDLKLPPPLPPPPTASGVEVPVNGANGALAFPSLPHNANLKSGPAIAKLDATADLAAAIAAGRKGQGFGLSWQRAPGPRAWWATAALPLATFVGILATGYLLVPNRATVTERDRTVATAAASPTGATRSGTQVASAGTTRGVSPSGAGAEQGTPAAAGDPPRDAAVTTPPPCGDPEFVGEPADAGLMRIKVAARCRAGQAITITYAGLKLSRKLDDYGRLDTLLDLFAERSAPVVIAFDDGMSKTLAATAKDLDRVTKVALIWQPAVNLDLHAFEYAARPGERGHVWASAPGTWTGAITDTVADKRGHGFISTHVNPTTETTAGGDHLEIYTFVHVDRQEPGTIAFAVDYETRGDKPGGNLCGAGALAEIPFQIVVKSSGGLVTRQAGVLAAAPCGGALSTTARYMQSALPVIKIRR